MNHMSPEMEKTLCELSQLADGDSDLVWKAIRETADDDRVFTIREVARYILEERLKRKDLSNEEIRRTLESIFKSVEERPSEDEDFRELEKDCVALLELLKRRDAEGSSWKWRKAFRKQKKQLKKLL